MSVKARSLPNDTLFHSIQNGDIEPLRKMLIDGVIDANMQIWWQFTQCNDIMKLELPLLHIASSKGNYIIASALIQFGAIVDATDKYGTTAIHWAATSGQNKIIKLLLKHNANINQRDLLGMTSLMCAAHAGRTKTVKYLLKMGADTTISSKQNQFALDLAKSANNKYCVAALTNMKNDKANKSKTQQKYDEPHDRSSSTIIHNDTEHLMSIPKRDISQLVLRESCSSVLSENEDLKLITEERVNELKLESDALRKGIKSLQSDTKYLKSLRNNKYKSVKNLKKKLKEGNNKLIGLKEEQQLTKSKLNKKKNKLFSLKEKQRKYNTEELKKELYYKLVVLQKINIENGRLQKERDQLINANQRLNEYNRLDVVKRLDGKELKRIAIDSYKQVGV